VSDLIVQLSLLDQLKADLTAIAAEYEKADDFSSDLADAVGDDELSGRVHEFSQTWNDRRKNMTEQVTALRDEVTAIRAGFTQVDAELGKALVDAAQQSKVSTP
jgi:hypothetical protein